MSESKTVIERFRTNFAWTEKLSELSDIVWLKPIAEGKASTAEIIAHLMRWDRYLITDVIPTVQSGGDIAFPDFDAFNAEAYKYAKSGVSKGQLLDELRATREELCELLLAADDDTRGKALPIIVDFIDHDNHHKSQIEGAIQ
ncbi:DinB family protein [Cohnella panacarvi]|uniref:DinB family protein n=1 Tax=Cohnella panacarvi TaxID=400776 RepID=UPI00047D3E6A|nr:DinB family protein [Cohnella panacarvi]